MECFKSIYLLLTTGQKTTGPVNEKKRWNSGRKTDDVVKKNRADILSTQKNFFRQLKNGIEQKNDPFLTHVQVVAVFVELRPDGGQLRGHGVLNSKKLFRTNSA